MQSRGRPNLFQHATRELSQDAFLAWLLDWLNYPTCQMTTCAKTFVESVLKISIDWTDFDNVKTWTQWKNIDLLAMIHFHRQKPIVVVIEDKVTAGLHNPLMEYSNRIMKSLTILRLPEDFEESALRRFVFKPSYLFGLVPVSPWKLIGPNELLPWMEQAENCSENCIIEDWLTVKQPEIYRAVKLPETVRSFLSDRTLLPNTKHEGSWCNHDIQFELFRQLFRVDKFVDSDERVRYPCYDFLAPYNRMKQTIERGNSSGRPWTVLKFCRDDIFYYQFDHGSNHGL